MVVKLRIPEKARILVEDGQKVKIGDPFYSTASEEELSISLVKELGIRAQDIFKFIKVVVGDSLHEGDILGERKKVIGKKTLTSPMSGTIKRIDHTSGSIVISTLTQSGSTIRTFFTGEIKSTSEGAGYIEVEIGKQKEFPGSGPEDCGGEWTTIESRNFFTYSSEDIKDRILLVDEVQSHIEAKIDALGGAGIIYVEGSQPTSIPGVQVNNETFEKIKEASCTYLLYSSEEQKIFGYN
jgi:hypothetical protein